MLFKVDYLLKDVEAYKAGRKPLPKYVVAEGIEQALKKAKEYENENVSILSCDLHISDGNVVVSKKYKGI